MATFRVGQRVKKIANSGIATPYIPIGTEGVVVAKTHPNPEVRDAFVVAYPGYTDANGFSTGTPSLWPICAFQWQIVPLTPDSQWADEQIAKLKRDVMKPIEIDSKQMEEVRG